MSETIKTNINNDLNNKLGNKKIEKSNNDNELNNSNESNISKQSKLGEKYKNLSHLQYLNKKINTLDLYNLKQIFQIIKENDENYTIKKKNILFNLGSLKQNTIDEITNFLIFIEKKQEELSKEEDLINEYKNMIKNSNN